MGTATPCRRPSWPGATSRWWPARPTSGAPGGVVALESGGEPQPAAHPIWQHVEHDEQAGDRFVVTAGGIVHDGVADGTVEHGVHDVMQTDFVSPIVVVATYEDGALVLRPEGLPGVEVRRWREGDQLVWQYHTVFTARLERVGPVEL